MVHHTNEGAVGIVINRPIGLRPLADLLRAIGEDASQADGEIRIFAGGPVQSELGFVLHESAYRRAGTFDIDGRVAMTSSPEVVLDICHHAGPQKYLVAFGYAGWGPRQLEAELALHAWATAPDDPALVFDEDRSKVWDSAMARAQGRP
jgi:putative transcriptional regulator